MTSANIVLHVIQCLDMQGIPYMLVGSFSSNLYGIPRSTGDADFVIQLREQSLSRLMADLGPEFQFDQQMTFETITFTSRHVIRHTASSFKVELFMLSDDSHDQQRFARRVSKGFEGRTAWVPTPEDVVITKLRWSRSQGRGKDADDVRNVLAVQKGNLDLDYIRRWCDIHGTRQLLEDLLAKVP